MAERKEIIDYNPDETEQPIDYEPDETENPTDHELEDDTNDDIRPEDSVSNIRSSYDDQHRPQRTS